MVFTYLTVTNIGTAKKHSLTRPLHASVQDNEQKKTSLGIYFVNHGEHNAILNFITLRTQKYPLHSAKCIFLRFSMVLFHFVQTFLFVSFIYPIAGRRFHSLHQNCLPSCLVNELPPIRSAAKTWRRALILECPTDPQKIGSNRTISPINRMFSIAMLDYRRVSQKFQG